MRDASPAGYDAGSPRAAGHDRAIPDEELARLTNRPYPTAQLSDYVKLGFVGRTETFSEDLRTVRARVGLNHAPPPRRNTSSSQGVTRDTIPDHVRRVVEEIYALDYQVLGY